VSGSARQARPIDGLSDDGAEEMSVGGAPGSHQASSRGKPARKAVDDTILFSDVCIAIRSRERRMRYTSSSEANR